MGEVLDSGFPGPTNLDHGTAAQQVATAAHESTRPQPARDLGIRDRSHLEKWDCWIQREKTSNGCLKLLSALKLLMLLPSASDLMSVPLTMS